MEYQVLAQKYRPKIFDEVIGQETIVRTLKNSISNNRIGSAYIFCGPRGVGKTSIARLIAKMINCEKPLKTGPCNKCARCSEINSGSSMDVLEIDGASNRGIDEIRTLRENVKFSPTSGNYKVYIIDEVHMLTQEAFNALLKTLEEPPKHVKFIFATTEAHKVLPTIMSRCQRFDFRRISPKFIYDRLLWVAEKEKIDIDEKAAILIARSSDGSLRDALVILDQMVSFTEDKISSSDVLDLLGMVHKEVIFSLANAVLAKKPDEVAITLDEIINSGKDPVFIANSIISHFRDLMILKTAGAPTSDMAFHDEELKELSGQKDLASLEEILYILQTLSHCILTMKGTMYTRVPLEIALIKIAKRDSVLALDEIVARLERLENGNGIQKSESRIQNSEASIQKPEVRSRMPESKSQKPDARIQDPESRVKTQEAITDHRSPITKNEPITDDREVRRSQIVESSSAKAEKPITQNETAAEGRQKTTTMTTDTAEAPEGPGIGLELWEKILRSVKSQKMSVYTFLKQAKPIKLKGNKAILAFDKEHAFNKDVLESGSNLAAIEDSFLSVTGSKPKIEFRVIEKDRSNEADQEEIKEKNNIARSNSNPAIENAMDVFGGKIVMDHME